MTAGAEQEIAVVVAERGVVYVGCDCVGRRFLFGEGDIEFHAERLLHGGNHGGQFVGEKPVVGRRHGEVHAHRAIGFAGCLRALGELFLNGSAGRVGIGVEREQSFWEVTVVHAIAADQGGNYVFVALLIKRPGK